MRNWESFAVIIREEMELQQLSQYRLSQITGVHRSTINRFLDLKHCPNFDTVLRILEKLNLNLKIEDN